MGGQNTSLMKECSDSISKLDDAELDRIVARFKSATAGKKRKVDRVMFAELLKDFHIPPSSCVRLFDAFDRKNVSRKRVLRETGRNCEHTELGAACRLIYHVVLLLVRS